jgi:hypothetical protein
VNPWQSGKQHAVYKAEESFPFTRRCPISGKHFFREHLVAIQRTLRCFREYSGNVEGLQGTLREHPENIEGIFRESSGNIQGTFREQ